MSLFAVYQYGREDHAGRTTPIGDGISTPSCVLLGLCRDEARAQRIVARIRRVVRQSLEAASEDGNWMPLVEVREYDPFDFLPGQERARLSRRQAHRDVTEGMRARREKLGL